MFQCSNIEYQEDLFYTLEFDSKQDTLCVYKEFQIYFLDLIYWVS